MIRINYYKTKFDALDNFYLWVGHGSSYNTAWDQSIYYSYKMPPETREIGEIVRIISMAVRLKKHGEPASIKREEILQAITDYGNLNLDKYCFTEEEFLAFSKAVEEAKQYIGYPPRAADNRMPDINVYQKGETDFFKMKCEALESFFDSVEKGNSYQEAAEQCTDSDHILCGQIGEIITAFTIVIRFDMCGKKISDLFAERLKRAVDQYSELDFKKYSLIEDEIEFFKGNFRDASGYFHNYRRQ